MDRTPVYSRCQIFRLNEPLTSAETTWHSSRNGQASDYSLNTPLAKTNSHLITPIMPKYPLKSPYARLGLRWHNTHFINSCNLDSFLTFIKIMSIKHPKMFIACFRLYDDVVHNTLKEIINTYQFVKEDNHLVDCQDEIVRLVWCQNVMKINRILGQQVDLAGSEEESVFNHMKRSMMFQWHYECMCGNDSRTGSQFLTRYCFSIEIGGQTQHLNGSLEPSPGPLFQKKCKRCHHPFSFKNILVPNTTWLLRVIIQKTLRSDVQNACFLAHRLSFGASRFKLGYITFVHTETPTIRHQTSCHLIQDQWFHYDGLNFGGELRKIDERLLPIVKYTPMNAIYYRIE
jgi:hypothetical protein